MGLFSDDIRTMEDLYLHTLKDIYYAEQQIEKALPKMIDKASAGPLRDGLESHLKETRTHVERLEEVFGKLGKTPSTTNCPAIDGIIKESNEISKEVEDASVLDAAIAAAAQAVEHYEMTRYGTLIAWSHELNRADCASILDKTLAEEKAADEKLTKLAEQRLNKAA